MPLRGAGDRVMKRSMTKMALAVTAALGAAGWGSTASAADGTFTGSGTGGGTAWLTVTNWSPAAVPGGTDTATIGTTSATTAIGVNMNGVTNNGPNNQAIGRIIYNAGASRSLVNS